MPRYRVPGPLPAEAKFPSVTYRLVIEEVRGSGHSRLCACGAGLEWLLAEAASREKLACALHKDSFLVTVRTVPHLILQLFTRQGQAEALDPAP